jgi:hypothetical protein
MERLAVVVDTVLVVEGSKVAVGDTVVGIQPAWA